MTETIFKLKRNELTEQDLELIGESNPDLIIPFHCPKCQSINFRILSTLNSIMILCQKCNFTISLTDIIDSLDNLVITPPKKEEVKK